MDVTLARQKVAALRAAFFVVRFSRRALFFFVTCPEQKPVGIYSTAFEDNRKLTCLKVALSRLDLAIGSERRTNCFRHVPLRHIRACPDMLEPIHKTMLMPKRKDFNFPAACFFCHWSKPP